MRSKFPHSSVSGGILPNLALFDFDGTITTNDNFTGFIFFTVSRRRLALGRLALSPLIVCYKLGFITPSMMRRMIARWAFSGLKEADIIAAGREYADSRIPKFIRPNALERLQWHRNQGDTIAIVSASLDAYLSRWCQQNKFDLICSRLEVHTGRLTGRYEGKDCTGKEKATRILSSYSLKSFERIYAYGDSAEDSEMLNLADIKIWRWQDKGASGSALE
jgi:HAD superfamily hydrolase (TIGR01490 family)